MGSLERGGRSVHTTTLDFQVTAVQCRGNGGEDSASGSHLFSRGDELIFGLGEMHVLIVGQLEARRIVRLLNRSRDGC